MRKSKNDITFSFISKWPSLNKSLQELMVDLNCQLWTKRKITERGERGKWTKWPIQDKYHSYSCSCHKPYTFGTKVYDGMSFIYHNSRLEAMCAMLIFMFFACVRSYMRWISLSGKLLWATNYLFFNSFLIIALTCLVLRDWRKVSDDHWIRLQQFLCYLLLQDFIASFSTLPRKSPFGIFSLSS